MSDSRYPAPLFHPRVIPSVARDLGARGLRCSSLAAPIRPGPSLTLLRKHLGRTGLGGQRLIELTRMSAVKERVCRREVRLTLNERGGRRPSCSGCSAEVYQPSDFLVRATTKPRAKRRFV